MTEPRGDTPLPADLDPCRHRRPSVAARLVQAVATLTALAVVVVSVGGWALVHVFDERIQRYDVFGGILDRVARGNGDAVNYLLVGSDRRDGMTSKDTRRLHVGSADGQRADTMIIAHVSRKQRKVTLLSLPRDSLVSIPAHRAVDGREVPERRDKLNTAYSSGGPTLTVRAIEHATGIHIDHYLEVSFLGFERMVDAVGGVDVCTRTPLRDVRAGLDLPAGRHRLDGRDSLAYVRARYVDNRGDIGRIERQQRFLAALVHEATSTGALLDAGRLSGFVGAALDAVRTDPGLEPGELLQLARKLRNLSPANVTFLTVPLADSNHFEVGVGSTVLWDDVAAQAVFAAIRDDRPLPTAAPAPRGPVATVAPERIRVRVRARGDDAGLARRVFDDLSRAGFAVRGSPGAGDEPASGVTVVRYDARYTDSVKTLQAALPQARFEKVTGLGRTFQVIAGSAYDGLRPVSLRAAAPPAPPRTAADDPCAQTLR